MAHDMTRRNFLYRVSAWFALLAGGSTAKIAWPARGAAKGTVRLIFYTDVHARQEWQTPAALKKSRVSH